MSDHARLSPSAAESWMTCAAYPSAIDGLVDETSELGAEGTAAHAISDDCLALGMDAYDFVDSKLTITERMGMRFDDIDEANVTDADFRPPVRDLLSADRLAWIVRHKGSIEKWLEALHANAINDCLAGNPVPGLKVVDGRRGRKKWADEKRADDWLAGRLGEKRFTIKLSSPAQALKLLPVSDRKPLMDSGLFVGGVPKPVLVDERDERPAKATVDEKL